jgi:hypothetical protein
VLFGKRTILGQLLCRKIEDGRPRPCRGENGALLPSTGGKPE